MRVTHVSWRIGICATLGVALATSLVAQAAPSRDVVQVARYTEVASASDAEIDPLEVVAQLRFPREAVATVGDALSYLLQRTGYAARARDDVAQRLFALPLPESHRALGPHRVRTLAQILVGESYVLCIDALSRLVGVEAAIGAEACAPHTSDLSSGPSAPSATATPAVMNQTLETAP